MTGQDILLVVGISFLAVAITVGDLLFSLRRHRQRASRRPAALSAPLDAGPNEAAQERRDVVRRRLAAIQAAQETGQE